MKRGNIILLSVLGIGAIIGTVVLVRKTTSAADTDDNVYTGGGNGGFNGGGGIGNTQLDYNLMLKRGMGWMANNAEVRMLQTMLNNIDKSDELAIDGLFGAKTEAKLKRNYNGSGQITLGAAKVIWNWA